MPSYDAGDASCSIFTFKDGILSAVAHDLEIACTELSIDIAEGQRFVDGAFEVRSLEVVHALSDGEPRPKALSERDKAEIVKNIQKDVLSARKHPTIRFSGTPTKDGDGYQLQGTLEIQGRSRKLVVPVRPEGDRWIAEVTLHQPDYGIKPFSAMLGTLKIKPDIRVRVSIPR